LTSAAVTEYVNARIYYADGSYIITSLPTSKYPEYEFTIEFGDGFEKQTGLLYAHLRYGLEGKYWHDVDLTKENKKGIELTPNSILKINQRSGVKIIDRLTFEWIKTGSEEGNVVNIKKFVVKRVEHTELVKEFTNNKPLASGSQVDFV